ncbi:MAG: M16 family metallopeptidase [Legionellales bacterium]
MKKVLTGLIPLILFLSQDGLANPFTTEKWVTKNGVPVVFYPAMEVPMLDINLAFAAGSAYDGAHYGLSALTAHLLNQGSAGQDATAIAESLADKGAQFSTETSKDMVVFNLRTLSRQDALEQSIKTFSQIINHPDFPEESFNREKKQLLMTIEQAKESPDEIANLNLFKSMYPNHPYAHAVNGTSTSLERLTKDEVTHFYKRYYNAENALLVLVGAIDSPSAHQLAEMITKELPKGQHAALIPKARPLAKATDITIPFPSSQTVIRLGQIGIDHHNPDYFPLMVGNYILGGGSLVSRLAVEVREKKGLTYGITSELVPMSGEGPFIIGFSTKNEQASKALTITKDTLQKFLVEGPSQKELEAAKLYITGSFPLSLASNRAIANLLLRMTFYNLPEEFLTTYVAKINAVTTKEIKEAFKKQVNSKALSLVKVGSS